ncbi:MAG: hypothetical protein JWP66_722 [Naasia sp.]|nr:hypothetical protein [Naasia sp.]
MTGPVLPALADLLRPTIATLAERDARTEAFAVLGRTRSLFGIGGRIVLRPAGRVWRLGVLLLAAPDGGQLYAVGSATRATDPRHPNFQSVSGEERRELRRIALDSGHPHGETVNFDAEPLALDEASLRAGSGPLLLDGDRLLVRWAPAQQHVPLAPYLAERAALLRRRDGGDDPGAAGQPAP